MVDYYYFSEMPYPDTPELDRYPSIRLTYPNKYFNPELGAQLYRRYLDEYAYAETAGFDGLMVNEHHNTPTCMHLAANLSAAALIQRTRHCKILSSCSGMSSPYGTTRCGWPKRWRCSI
jgi:hypothetical protein